MRRSHADGFERFCYQEFSAVIRHLLVQGFNADVAADAVQEAMLLLFQHWDSVESPRAWTRITARRFAVKEAKRTRSLVYELEQLGEKVEYDLSLSWLTMKDEQTEVLEAISSLPPQQRIVMAWHFDGYTPHEIAFELHMNPSTVSSNLRHARIRLRQQFDKGWR